MASDLHLKTVLTSSGPFLHELKIRLSVAVDELQVIVMCTWALLPAWPMFNALWVYLKRDWATVLIHSVAHYVSLDEHKPPCCV